MISVDNRLQTVGILLDVLREIDHIDSSRKQYYLHSRQLDKDDNIMESANTRPINNQERERERDLITFPATSPKRKYTQDT